MTVALFNEGKRIEKGPRCLFRVTPGRTAELNFHVKAPGGTPSQK